MRAPPIVPIVPILSEALPTEQLRWTDLDAA
jgi:hypothetical protein